MLFIPREFIYNITLETSKTIINHVNFVLSKIGEVDLIIYTGGFSNNELFQKIIEKYKEGNRAKTFFFERSSKNCPKRCGIIWVKLNSNNTKNYSYFNLD